MTTNDAYKLLLKKNKIHDRFSVGLRFVKSPLKHNLLLYTFAQDSIKLWNVVASEESFDISEIKKIDGNFCGIQSFDVQTDGQLISVVGVESTLHRISIDESYNTTITNTSAGLMEMWFTQILPDKNAFFTASFSGFLKVLDAEGNSVKTSPFDKVKLISAIRFSNSGNLIAIGNSQGWISIIDSDTLLTLFSIEAHACKIRCLQFTNDDTQLLSGSDDKIVKLYTLSDIKGTLAKNFCGHRGAVMHLDVDKSLGGERFASVGLDNRVIVWDVASGEKLHVFKNDSTDFFRGVAFSPDSRFIATTTDDSALLVYRVPQPENYVSESIEEENEVDYENHNFVANFNSYSPPAAANSHNGFGMSPPNDHETNDTQAIPSLTPSPTEMGDNHFSFQTNDYSQTQEEMSYDETIQQQPESPKEQESVESPNEHENVEFLKEQESGLMDVDESMDRVSTHDEPDQIDNVEDPIDKYEQQPTTPNETNDNQERSTYEPSQQPANYQEEFERQELEMQLGID